MLWFAAPRELRLSRTVDRGMRQDSTPLADGTILFKERVNCRGQDRRVGDGRQE